MNEIMDKNNSDQLFLKYLHGELSAKENQQIRDYLEQNPRAGHKLLHLAEEELFLREGFKQPGVNAVSESTGVSKSMLTSLDRVSSEEELHPKKKGMAVAHLGIAAVAMILVSLGWYYYLLSSSGPAAPGQDTLATEKMFLFVRAENLDTDQPVALLHELDNFEMVHRSRGDKVFDQTLVDIQANGVGMRDLKGDTSFLTQDYLQMQFNDAVKVEVKIMWQQVREGKLKDKNFNRLEQYALMDQELAVNLLENISRSNSKFAREAKKIIGNRKENSYIKNLLAKVKNPGTPGRSDLINGLGDFQGAAVFLTLQDIAQNEQEPLGLRILAVKTMAKFRNHHTLEVFGLLLQDDALPAELCQEITKRKTKIAEFLSSNNGDSQK
ncbi:hypothetical protein ACFL54_07040 [Planctomycetota bacterium]